MDIFIGFISGIFGTLFTLAINKIIVSVHSRKEDLENKETLKKLIIESESLIQNISDAIEYKLDELRNSPSPDSYEKYEEARSESEKIVAEIRSSLKTIMEEKRIGITLISLSVFRSELIMMLQKITDQFDTQKVYH